MAAVLAAAADGLAVRCIRGALQQRRLGFQQVQQAGYVHDILTISR